MCAKTYKEGKPELSQSLSPSEDSFIYSSPIQKCTKCYVNDEGLSKDTEIAAQWVEKGKVYSKLPRLREARAGRISKVIREHVPGTKGAILG